MNAKLLTFLSLLLVTSAAVAQGCGGTSGDASVPDDAGTAAQDSSTATDSGDPAAQDAAGNVVPEAGSDAATADSGRPDAGGTCNAVVQEGASLDILATQTAAPTPQGGTLSDGTWIGTSAKMWGSSSAEGTKVGVAGAATWEVKGTTAQVVMTSASTGKVTRRTLTLSAAGTTMTFHEECANPPSAALLPAQFTATATTASVFYAGAGSATLELAFTKK